jgi:hypothetical protein
VLEQHARGIGVLGPQQLAAERARRQVEVADAAHVAFQGDGAIQEGALDRLAAEERHRGHLRERDGQPPAVVRALGRVDRARRVPRRRGLITAVRVHLAEHELDLRPEP